MDTAQVPVEPAGSSAPQVRARLKALIADTSGRVTAAVIGQIMVRGRRSSGRA